LNGLGVKVAEQINYLGVFLRYDSLKMTMTLKYKR